MSSSRDAGRYKVVVDGQPEPPAIGKPRPPYAVPSMAEIAAIPWNGLKVASTFSGCGGSCTGYRMAGFRVVWASEFVPIAQDSYRANMAEGSILDGRDIRLVKPEDILAAAGLAAGELDVFDGSPPCQAFSTAGKREKGWGTAKKYEHGAEQCNETLFDEYVRLLRGLQPRVFVAENVSGLVKGTAKGWFIEVMKSLKESGYRVSARLLDAQWLGVPQARERIIFVGVRDDLKREPAHPKPFVYRYSVRDALPWIASLRADRDEWRSAITPSATIVASDGGRSAGWHGLGMVQDGENRRKFTIQELKAICGFPADYVLCGSYAKQWERLGNAVPPVMMKAIAETIRDQVLGRPAAETNVSVVDD
jgi:DNA (cytosine-5)-methyltransferase 1